MMKKCVHVQSLSGGARGRANVCKGLKVPLCFISLMQILFPHYIEINYINSKKKKKKRKTLFAWRSIKNFYINLKLFSKRNPEWLCICKKFDVIH